MHSVSSRHGVQGQLFKFVGYPEPAAHVLWIDWAKVIAAFAVVMTHVASIAWHNLDPDTLAWHITSFYEISTRFCVPFFFISSGALLLNPKRDVSITKIYGKYIPRVLLALAMSSLLFSAAESYLFGWSGWKNVLLYAIDGPYFVWYLWVLIALYIFTPILRQVSHDPVCLKYSVSVFAVLILGKSTVESMWPGSIIDTLFQNVILISRGSEGVFYYLLGAFLSSHEIFAPKRPLLYLTGLSCLIVALVLNWRHAVEFGLDSYFVARDNILIAAYSVALIEFLKSVQDSIRFDTPLNLLIETGLHIYLVHPFVRLAMEAYAPSAISWLSGNPLIAIPLISLVIYCCTFVISLGLLGIPRLVSPLSGRRSR